MALKTRRLIEISKILSIAPVLLFFADPALADFRGLYGLGARSAAVAGSDRALGSDAFSLSSNPANISQSKNSQVSLGVAMTAPQFPKLSGIVVDNVEQGGSSSVVGESNPGIPNQGYFQFGVVSQLGPAWKVGLNFFAPIDKFIEAKSVDVYRPNYTLYDGNPQKLSLNFGVAREILPGLAIGIGGAVYYETSAVVVGRLNTAPQTSTFNVGATARPGIAPHLGISATIAENHILGLSYLGARDYRINAILENTINPWRPVPLNIAGGSSLFYDPATVNIAYAGHIGRFQIFTSLDYEVWSPYEGSAFKGVYQGFNINQAQVATPFKNIFVPRLGGSMILSSVFVLRMGYAYRPTAAPDPSLSAGNILDADRHVAALGLTYDTGTWDGFWTAPFLIDLNLQGHFLQNRIVTKPNATDIGAPGYTIGGSVIQTGLQISMAF